MIVYRVENPADQCGPYFRSPEDPDYNVCAVVSRRHAAHPCPWDEGLTFEPSHDSCGFASMDSLLDWFGTTLENLEGIGWHIAAYEIDQSLVHQGARQLVYPRSGGECVDSRSIYDAVRFPYEG